MPASNRQLTFTFMVMILMLLPQSLWADYRLLDFWGDYGSGKRYFNNPFGLTLDSKGNVYVADSFNNRIQKFRPDGEFIIAWGAKGMQEGLFQIPCDIVVSPDNYLYVTDAVNNRIQKFDLNGKFILSWGSEGYEPGQFRWPCGIAADAAGDIYIADAENGRVQKFNSLGVFMNSWGTVGTGEGEFKMPLGIAVDNSGNIFIADSHNNRIQKLDGRGAFVEMWGALGKKDGEFDSPNGIAVDAGGNIYVADTNNDRIQKFSPDGKFIDLIGFRGFDRPSDVVVDMSGLIYITDAENHRIQKYGIARSLSIWTSGTGSGTVKVSPKGFWESYSEPHFYPILNIPKTITLKATQAADSKFVSWEGADCINGDNTEIVCQLIMDEDRDVTAVFERIPKYTLVVNKEDVAGGSVSASPRGLLKKESSCDVGASVCETPKKSIVIIDNPPCKTICQDKYLENYDNPTVVTLRARPVSGWRFDFWEGASCLEGNNKAITCKIVMNNNYTITPHFEKMVSLTGIYAYETFDARMIGNCDIADNILGCSDAASCLSIDSSGWMDVNQKGNKLTINIDQLSFKSTITGHSFSSKLERSETSDGCKLTTSNLLQSTYIRNNSFSGILLSTIKMSGDCSGLNLDCKVVSNYTATK